MKKSRDLKHHGKKRRSYEWNNKFLYKDKPLELSDFISDTMRPSLEYQELLRSLEFLKVMQDLEKVQKFTEETVEKRDKDLSYMWDYPDYNEEFEDEDDYGSSFMDDPMFADPSANFFQKRSMKHNKYSKRFLSKIINFPKTLIKTYPMVRA